MSNAALWREVLEDKHGLAGLRLSEYRRDMSLKILDSRLSTLKGMGGA